MAARNPGPFIHQTPIGFPSYCRKMNKDWMARRAFQEGEVNTRVYKVVYETLGIKGRIPANKVVGKNRIRLRCIHNGVSNGVPTWTGMSRHGFMQAYREGWMNKYGLDVDRRH